MGHKISAIAGSPWTAGRVATVRLPLASLPRRDGSTHVLRRKGRLDVIVEDDTGVDALRIE